MSDVVEGESWGLRSVSKESGGIGGGEGRTSPAVGLVGTVGRVGYTSIRRVDREGIETLE
jgi:hypothetical protein